MDYAKVLIIDTNIELYDYSVAIWANYGIKTHRVNSIEQSLEELSVCKYHLIVIVERKEKRPFVLDSIKLFQELTYSPIVIASTDLLDPEYCIAAYDLSADEVWEMPEHIEVAVAKGNAIIRRYLQLNKEIDRQSTLIVNKCVVLSTEQRLVYVKGNKVELTKTEFDILALLITRPGKVFASELILNAVWANEYSNDNKVLRNHIYRLRDKLKVDATSPNYIMKHQGIGYSFTPVFDS